MPQPAGSPGALGHFCFDICTRNLYTLSPALDAVVIHAALCYPSAITTMPKKLDLVGLAEAAEMAGVSRQTIWNWKRAYAHFPKPVAELRAGPIWMREDMKNWLDARRKAKDLLKKSI